MEGTILTVARGIAKEAYHAVRRGEDFTEILTEAIAGGKKELARTPELLPALKAAGVVDAGGQGLIVFLQGCLNGLLAKTCRRKMSSIYPLIKLPPCRQKKLT